MKVTISLLNSWVLGWIWYFETNVNKGMSANAAGEANELPPLDFVTDERFAGGNIANVANHIVIIRIEHMSLHLPIRAPLYAHAAGGILSMSSQKRRTEQVISNDDHPWPIKAV